MLFGLLRLLDTAAAISGAAKDAAVIAAARLGQPPVVSPARRCAASVPVRRTRPRAPHTSPPRPSLSLPVPVAQPPSSAPVLVQRDRVLVVVIK